jgi:predicted amidophosphoribosyltransferase
LQDAFTIKKDYRELARDSRILLIDDVYTTGSTIQSCRNVLLKAGATQVDAAVIAMD